MSRIDQLHSWHDDWKDLKVVVFGLGVSGFSAADTLAELGAEVLVVAAAADEEQLEILDVLGVSAVITSDNEELLSTVQDFAPELIITSPGVRPEHDLINWAKESSVPVWVDIDLAWRLRDKVGKPAEWFLITGTNGKTTTAQLLEHIFLTSGLRAMACGNIGTPILDAIRVPDGLDALVVELSSFQLHYMGQVSPHSAAVLNLDLDHLDWHGSFENYRDAKAKVYQQVRIACVYNGQDLATERMVEEADVVEGARAIAFTLAIPARSQVGYVEEILADRAFLDDRANSAIELATTSDIEQISVLTDHLKQNVAAASALARAAGVEPAAIQQAIRSFKLDGHRIELVLEKDQIRWFDDSKATNVHATAASLKSFDSVIWLVGGLLKGVEIEPLIAEYANRIKFAIVLGKDADPVLAAFAKVAPHISTYRVKAESGFAVMVEAVEAAKKIAAPTDVVLLAPAAASMDQFKDYAERGNLFANAVRELVS